MTTSGRSDVVAFRRRLRRIAPSIERDLPWLSHPDPWAILVSEVMLQQTSTARVVGPWRRFLERFPTPRACAEANLADVLESWRGLGYHRRARSLYLAARRICSDFGGEVPSGVADLRSLPGVGEYTAHAVASFAFGERVAVLDTNVGRVLARALANRTLTRREARTLAATLLPRGDSASFNQSMLDLGAQFCSARPRCVSCPVASRCAWQKEGGPDPAPRSAGVSRAQARFEGSNRQLRGRVLEVLRARPHHLGELGDCFVDVEATRRDEVLAGLVRDGLVARRASRFELATR